MGFWTRIALEETPSTADERIGGRGWGLEHSSEARREWWAGPESYRAPAAAAQEWNGPEPTRPFVARIEEVLGAAQEPDPLFFIESWTAGVSAAAENFAQRRQVRERAPAYPAFDSFVPSYTGVYEKERSGEAEVAAVPAAAPMGRYGFSWVTVGSATDTRSGQNPEAELGSDLGEEFERETGGGLTLPGACRLLGVAASSTREQIKAAYRRMASRYHPDRAGRRSEEERQSATERMVSINEAYRLLCGARFGESA